MRGNTVRKPIVIVAVVAALVVAGLGIGYVIWLQQSGRVVTEGERLNLVLVVEQSTVDGSGLEIELVSLVPGIEAVFLAIPSDLGALSDTGESLPLRDVYVKTRIDGLRTALETLFSIRIDYHVVVRGESLDAAIDDLGGLSIDVRERVVYTDRSIDPAMQIDLRPGEQRLDGAMVLGFLRGASDVADDGERQNQALVALLRASLYDCLLGGPGRWTRDVHAAIETDLGSKAFGKLIEALSGLGSSGFETAVVPRGEWVDEETGYARLRVIETQRMIAKLVRGVDLLTADEVSVAVFNGNGVRMLASRLSDYLGARGFQVSAIANAESFAYNASYVVVLTDEAKAAILRDALPRDALIVGPEEFEPHYTALRDLIPEGTDLMLVAGAEMELD